MNKIAFTLVLMATTIAAVASQGVLVGGITNDEKKATPDLQATVDSVAAEIKSAAMMTLTTSGGQANGDVATLFQNSKVKALTYKSQLVAGTNYFVKVQMANMIFHVRIYQTLQGNVSVNKVVGPKAESDPILYF